MSAATTPTPPSWPASPRWPASAATPTARPPHDRASTETPLSTSSPTPPLHRPHPPTRRHPLRWQSPSPSPHRSPLQKAQPKTPAPACTTPLFVFGAGLTPASLLDELVTDDARIREIIHPGQSAPEPRYIPSRALADFVRCRDLTCRFPGCDKPATLADIDHTVPYPAGPTHPSNLKCLCRFHHLLKTFWVGATGWQDRQEPDGTIVWTSPTGHIYTTHPGSRLLFPTLCRPTATLWTGDPPTAAQSDRRGAMMPRRRNTRAHNRAHAITAERKRNQTARIAVRAAAALPHLTAYESPTEWCESDYGNDPPPF